jgi:hypothetical protein
MTGFYRNPSSSFFKNKSSSRSLLDRCYGRSARCQLRVIDATAVVLRGAMGQMAGLLLSQLLLLRHEEALVAGAQQPQGDLVLEARVDEGGRVTLAFCHGVISWAPLWRFGDSP